MKVGVPALPFVIHQLGRFRAPPRQPRENMQRRDDVGFPMLVAERNGPLKRKAFDADARSDEIVEIVAR